MNFLIDEDLPRSTDNLLRQYGHEAINVRDTGLRGSTDTDIATYAQKHGLCLLTGDMGFADIRNYPPGKYSGIVVLRLPTKANSFTILSILKSLLSRTEIIDQLNEKLAIVELGRVRLRKS